MIHSPTSLFRGFFDCFRISFCLPFLFTARRCRYAAAMSQRSARPSVRLLNT